MEKKPLSIKFDQVLETYAPVGKHAKFYTRKIGTLMGSKIPLATKGWNGVGEEDKDLIFHELETYFDFDEYKRDPNVWENVVRSTMRIAAARLRRRKFDVKSDYISNKERPDYVDPLDWENCIDMWEDSKVQARAEKNANNRRHKPTTSLHGSRSIAEFMHENADTETGELPSAIETYKKLHWNEKKGWRGTSELNYEKMIERRYELLEEQSYSNHSSPNLNSPDARVDEVEVMEHILGKRYGYRLGVGPILPGMEKRNPSRKRLIAENSKYPDKDKISRNEVLSIMGNYEKVIGSLADTVKVLSDKLGIPVPSIPQLNVLPQPEVSSTERRHEDDLDDTINLD